MSITGRSAGSRSSGAEAPRRASIAPPYELAPDLELRFEVLDGDDRHVALVSGGHGHAATEAGGGAFVVESVFVFSLADGRIHRAEQFDLDQRDAALARLAELTDG